MKNYPARKRLLAMKLSTARRTHRLFAVLVALFTLGLLLAVCSCSLFREPEPDPFTDLFNAVAAQSAAQIRMTPPKSAAVNWRRWQLSQPVKLEESK